MERITPTRILLEAVDKFYYLIYNLNLPNEERVDVHGIKISKKWLLKKLLRSKQLSRYRIYYHPDNGNEFLRQVAVKKRTDKSLEQLIREEPEITREELERAVSSPESEHENLLDKVLEKHPTQREKRNEEAEEKDETLSLSSEEEAGEEEEVPQEEAEEVESEFQEPAVEEAPTEPKTGGNRLQPLGRLLNRGGGKLLRGVSTGVSRGGGLAAKAGGAAAQAGARGLIAFGAASGSGIAVAVAIAIIIIVLLVVGVPALMSLFKSSSILPPYQVAQLPNPGSPNLPPSFPEPGFGLDYSIPIRDSSVQVIDPEAIKALIKSTWPNAQLQSWDTIIQQSVQNGWNPAFVLTLWIEETGAQGVPSYTDALGCDPTHPTTDINTSLKCLFTSFSRFTNDQFADFMCTYSESRRAPCSFKTNPNFPGNIKTWYSRLVPSGPGAITNIPTPTPSSDKTSVVYYCQGNTAWKDVCALGSGGCGPASLAIVLSSFEIPNSTPPEVDTTFRQNGWRTCSDDGSQMEGGVLRSTWLGDLGMTVGKNITRGGKLNIALAKQYLDNGYLIIGSSYTFPIVNARIPGSRVSHIFVVDNLTPINLASDLAIVSIRDPNNCSYADGNDEIQANVNRSSDFITWDYAYPLKKIK